MNKKIFNSSIIAILIIGGLIGYYLWKNLTSRPSFSQMTVQRGNISDVLNLSGKVESQNSADLGFAVYGQITELPHQVGDHVNQGDILAQVDSQDLTAQLSQANSLLQSAQDILQQDKELKVEQQDKLESLKNTGASGSDKRGQQKQINAQEHLVEAQQAQIDAAEANVTNAQAQIDKTIIRAPFSGVIAHQEAKVGEAVLPGTPVLTLINDKAFEVDAEVSQMDVPEIQIGDAASFTLNNNSGVSYGAKVSQIEPAETDINGVSNYKVTFNIADNSQTDPNLLSGADASITFVSQNQKDALIIPQNAVFTEGSDKFVYVPGPNKDDEKKKVETGIYGPDGMVEITSGLAEGDEISVLKSQ